MPEKSKDVWKIINQEDGCSQEAWDTKLKTMSIRYSDVAICFLRSEWSLSCGPLVDRRSERLPKNTRAASIPIRSSRVLFYIHKTQTHWPRTPRLAVGKTVSPKQPMLGKSGKTTTKGQAAQRELGQMLHRDHSAQIEYPVWLQKVPIAFFTLTEMLPRCMEHGGLPTP